MKPHSKSQNLLCWVFGVLFVIVGILNIIKIHTIPGLFYIFVALLMLPTTNAFLNKTFKIIIPFLPKLIIFILIMWATLAVGDLAEIYGLQLKSNLNNHIFLSINFELQSTL